MKPNIEEVFTRSKDKSTPVLLKFQNGDLTNPHKDCTLYFSANHSTEKSKRAVVVTAGNVYTGLISDGSNDLTDTYICIHNKLTNKVRILPIDQVKLMNNVYEEKEKMQFETLSRESAMEKATRDFGGRRELRGLTNRERNKVSVDIIQEQLETAVENSLVTETQEDVASTKDVVDSIRPKCNKDATNLTNVYSVCDVIPLELIDRLDEEVAVLFNTDIDDIPISSEFLKGRITLLKKGPQSSQTLLKMKIIIYMDGLLNLIKSRGKFLKRIELSQITEKVENDIRERFSDEKSLQQLRTSSTNEKALCHYLVLGFLLTEEFELDLTTLSTELEMAKAKILRYGNIVYATLKAKTNTIALRLPSSVKPMSFAYVGKRKKQ